MKLRWVLRDKNAGLSTNANPLALEASARLVLPGYKDIANIKGELRRDAPTGSRIAQHILLIFAASHPEWKLVSADVRSAFSRVIRTLPESCM